MKELYKYENSVDNYITAPKDKLGKLIDHLLEHASDINTGGYWDFRFKITFNRVSQEWEARVSYV